MTGPVRRALGVAWILGLASAGCGGGGPTLATVGGTVTRSGQPVEGAAVMFLPTAAGGAARPAQDTTGADGSFRLTTDGRTGAVPGKYTVTIVETPQSSSPEAADAADDPVMAAMAPSDPRASRRKKAAAPARPTTLEREVSAAGNTFDFDLAAAAPKG